jgi:integrase
MAEIRINKDAKSNPYWFQIMVNGKRVTRRGFKTKTEAKLEMAEVINELNKGDYIDPSKMTFGDYFKNWLDGRDNLANTTRNTYESYYTVHIVENKIEKVPLSKLSALNIHNFIKELRDKPKPLSDGMIKGIFKTINASLNSAEKMGLVNNNVASKVEKPKVKWKERSIWSNDSVKHMLISSKGESRYWIAVFLAVMTGMRQGEILGLKWTDIDFEKKTIHIKRGLRKDSKEFTELKTEKSRRVIAISDGTIEALRQHKEMIELEMKSKVNYKDHGIVVCTSKGTPSSSSRIIVTWGRFCEKFKPENEPLITFHDLRHQSASIMLNGGTDIRIVSQRLGHSTVSTTLNVYSHLLPNAQEKAAQSLDSLISSGMFESE